MNATKISSRDFNQDIGKAKRASAKGPVIITDRGKPAHVLLSIEHYQALSAGAVSILELLGDERAAAIAFDPIREKDSSLRIPDLPR